MYIMNALEVINSIVVLVGVPSVLGSVLYLGRKLQILDSLDDTTRTIKHNLTVVTNFLIKHNQEFDSSELQTFSPLQLTDVGKELIKHFDFENIFNVNKAEFFKFIDSENPKLKYDVEVSAVKSIIALSNEPFMDFLKIYFYNNPNRNFDNISPTLGIYVRDKYLSEHPEIIR